jgi:hypothetical protein
VWYALTEDGNVGNLIADFVPTSWHQSEAGGVVTFVPHDEVEATIRDLLSRHGSA